MDSAGKTVPPDGSLTVLDSLTAVGVKWLEKQADVVARYARWTRSTAIETPVGTASIDVVFTRNGRLAAAAEVKCRNLSYAELSAFGTYLVTKDKIDRGIQAAYHLGVPFLLIVGLYPEKRILWRTFKYGESYGVSEETATRKNCNEQVSIVRENVFIPVTSFQEVPQ